MALGNEWDWRQNQYAQPSVYTSGTTNIFYGSNVAVQAPAPEPEKSPLDWLRGEVDEVCALGRSAL